MKYYAGMDIGGTTSTIICFDYRDQQIHSRQHQGIPVVASSPSKAVRNIGFFIDELASHFQGAAPNAVACGIAGAGRKQVKNQIQTGLNQEYPDIQFYITDDIKAAHAGAFGGKNGILIMAGTGSAVAGKQNGRWYRSGGYGYLLGDEGSGYEIGRKGLRLAARQMDANKSRIFYKLLQEHLQISNRDELTTMLYSNSLRVSRFAKHLLDAADEGNKKAQKVVDDELDLLVETASVVIDKYPASERVLCLHGSLFLSNYYNRSLKQKITVKYPSIQFTEALHPPAKGVCMLMNNNPN